MKRIQFNLIFVAGLVLIGLLIVSQKACAQHVGNGLDRDVVAAAG